MKLPISRGRISHTLFEDVVWLFRSFFSKINDSRTIDRFERLSPHMSAENIASCFRLREPEFMQF